jgi:hypothetical protein
LLLVGFLEKFRQGSLRELEGWWWWVAERALVVGLKRMWVTEVKIGNVRVSE